MKKLMLTAAAALASAVGAQAAMAAITSSETERLTAAARVVEQIRADIPQEYWNRAHCVTVIPDLKKAAFIIGGEFGKGVMSCRSADRWSAPVFMQLAKGSWGFQAGAEQVDVVTLIMNEAGVQKLLQNKVTLGADASVAAGPMGRQGQVATDAALKAEILSYSRAQGLFAGIDLSGGVLRPDEDANRDVYGNGANPRTILASRDISAPTQASAFLNALGSASAPAAAKAAPAPEVGKAPTPRSTTVPPTTDSDVRLQLVQMQQSLDRLLAGANQGTAVGTAGTVNSGSITIDRAQIEQLRRQLDAALAALDKR
jgi:lipid-binding SYLF domain-containing protein